MLPATELRDLSHWCRDRGVTWSPARTDEGTPAVMLAPGIGAARAPALLLVDAADEWRLLDAGGEQVAVASRLGLLLDALDAGVICAGVVAAGVVVAGAIAAGVVSAGAADPPSGRWSARNLRLGLGWPG